MIRVLLAAGTALGRARASTLLAGQPGLEMAAVCRVADDLVRQAAASAADVVVLGSGLWEPGPRNLVRRLRSEAPVPLVLVAEEGESWVLEALEEGAAEFVVLPSRWDDAAQESAALELGAVLRQVAARGREALSPRTRPARIPTAPGGYRRPTEGKRSLVILGASTGGPRAVQSILEALPATLDAAVVAALHMPPVFTRMFAERLARVCRLAVAEAADGEILGPGAARILPGGQQASILRLGSRVQLRLRARRPDEVHAPSVDHVMQSAARSAGAATVGVILSGMGEDGRKGLLALREAGGYTVAESERTALIFGMPGEAIRAGAAAVVLPLERIPPLLVERCGLR